MSHATTPITAIQAHGQSVWIDFISREFLDSGNLRKMIETDDLRGVTSNPTIFEKAIGYGSQYDEQFKQLVKQGADAQAVYDALTTTDIRNALDLFKETYTRTKGLDGYVSLEVSPILANDTEKTISEAVRLWKILDRPNAMIKIPGTPAGLPAIEECLFQGININVTLLFSVHAYEAVARAYVRALERRAKAGLPVSGIASVASFFVSRIDAEVDKLLDGAAANIADATQRQAVEHLKGKVAIANAKEAYAVYEQIFGSPEFAALKSHGAHVQRLLWASVGTKNPSYPDTIYVDELIGPDTVSTMPPETYNAVRDHGKVSNALTHGLADARHTMSELAKHAIDFNSVTDKLLKVGVERFSADFETLMKSIREKRDKFAAELS